MKKLSKNEWNILDGLISKLGFGGYYDLVEILKMTANNLINLLPYPKEKKNKFTVEINRERDFYALVMAINLLSDEVKNPFCGGTEKVKDL